MNCVVIAYIDGVATDFSDPMSEERAINLAKMMHLIEGIHVEAVMDHGKDTEKLLWQSPYRDTGK